MMKCLKFLTLLSIIMLNENVQGKPQDIGEAAILAFAQAKDTFDNGAAASDKKEFEIFGAKFKNDMEVGFGDAIRSKRNVHLTKFDLLSPLTGNFNLERKKRSVNLTQQIINSKETLRTKRETDDNSIEIDGSEEYDYSSSYEYSYSSESEDVKRRKRSASFDQFAELFFVNN